MWFKFPQNSQKFYQPAKTLPRHFGVYVTLSRGLIQIVLSEK